MKWIAVFILLIGFAPKAVCQIDTVVVDTENTALNFKKCNKYLFGYKRRLSSPVLDQWTSIDSAFMRNSDTIYFQIINKSALRIEGKKMPDGHSPGVIGEIKIYNSRSRLIRTEYWTETIIGSNAGETLKWSEVGTWQTKRIHHKNGTEKILIRSLKYSDKKGWQKVTKIERYANDKIWHVRTKYRK